MTRLQNPGGPLYNNIPSQYMDLKHKVTPGCYQYTSVVLSQKMCQLSGDRCPSKGTSNVNRINDDGVTNNSNPGVLLMKKIKAQLAPCSAIQMQLQPGQHM